MYTLDAAYALFKERLDFFKKYNFQDISESDTRSKVIDSLLELLGWTEDDIERERFVKVGYYDYEVSTSLFRFVIEAKKSFVEFTLPLKGRKVKIKTIYKQNKDVIDQIRSYIFERGLLYGVITNGRQFVISKFLNTDGTDWQDNDALIFQDLNTVDANFIQFFEVLSKEYIQHFGRFKLFNDSNQGKTLVRSNNLKRKDEELVRNKASHELIPVITSVFEEIYNLDELNEEEILKECYIKNEDIKKYNSELGFIFSDLPPTFDSRINPVQNTGKTHSLLTGEILGTRNKLPDPIIIIGGKGAGKSTFIKYFLEVVLDKSVKKNRPLLYIDFRNETENTIKDTKSIYQKLLNQLYNVYQNLNLNSFNVLKVVYSAEIENQKKGYWSHINEEERINEKISEFIERLSLDPIAHLSRISNYLIQKNNKRICIVIDNADQLDEHIQNEVFILAHSLHRNLKVIVLISLREGYFFKFKNKPPFDAYHSTIFHITSPPYREVLKKRIRYVLNHYKFETVKFYKDNITLEFTEGSLTHLFENLYQTLFTQSHSEILSFLEETSYPNIRNGLEKFKFFLLSGHTKTNIYMSFEYGKNGKSNIPIWEFVKSVALESNYYYQSNNSSVFNLLYPAPNNKNHFTKIRIIDFIIDSNVELNRRNNFITVKSLIEIFTKAGYTSDIIIEELNLMYASGLIFTNDFANDVEAEIKIDIDDEIGVTQAGVFYVKQLLNKFYYLDLIVQDTPIYNEKFFDELTNNFPESDQYGNRDINKRKLTLGTFMRYLMAQEKLDHSRKELNYNIKCLDRQIIKGVLESGLKTDIERIDRYLSTV